MVTYDGHIVAFCTARRAYLIDDLDAELDGERIGPLLLAMCVYAIEVQRRPWPIGYRELDARRFAHAMLIPDEILEHPDDFEPAAISRWPGLPARELAAAIKDHRRATGRTRLASPTLASASSKGRSAELNDPSGEPCVARCGSGALFHNLGTPRWRCLDAKRARQRAVARQIKARLAPIAPGLTPVRREGGNLAAG